MSIQKHTPLDVIQLTPPALDFFPGSTKIKKVVKEAVRAMLSAHQMNSILYSEMIILSRFITRRSRKYRNDKGFRTIQKISKAVNLVYSLDLKSALSVVKFNMIETYIPSKELGQWLLIKVESYGKLLKRISDCCVTSATMLNHRLRTGHNWTEVMMALSMVSRLWAITNFLLKNCCESYQKLYSVRTELPSNPKAKDWLPMTYKFPKTILDSSDIRSEKPEENKSVPVVAGREEIAAIKSHSDLERFISQQEEYRCSESAPGGQNYATKNLDALQWHMFSRNVNKWIRVLKKTEDRRREKLLILIRKRMLQWIS